MKEYENSYYCLLESKRKLQHKANRWDAEMERQRVKNRKYRERKKAEKAELSVTFQGEPITAKEIAEKYLGVEIEYEVVICKICGYCNKSIIVGFDDASGWTLAFDDIILKEHVSYLYAGIEDVLPQLKNL